MRCGAMVVQCGAVWSGYLFVLPTSDRLRLGRVLLLIIHLIHHLALAIAHNKQEAGVCGRAKGKVRARGERGEGCGIRRRLGVHAWALCGSRTKVRCNTPGLKFSQDVRMVITSCWMPETFFGPLFAPNGHVCTPTRDKAQHSMHATSKKQR